MKIHHSHPAVRMKRNSRYAFTWHSLELALVLALLLDGWNLALVSVLVLVAVVGWAWSLGHLR